MRSSQDVQNIITSSLSDDDFADIVIVLGPRHEEAYKKICRKFAELGEQGLRYAILGDGKSPVTIDGIRALPEAQYVLINGHGDVRKSIDGHNVHQMQFSSLDKKYYDDSANFVSEIQSVTGSKDIIVLSCYSGKLNQQFKRIEQLEIGTNIITTADKAHPCYNWGQIDDFAEWILLNPDKPMSEFFAKLIASYPETISFGMQRDDQYAHRQIKSGMRGVLNDTSIPEWISFNMINFNQLLARYHMPIAAMPLINLSDYKMKSLFYHLAHLDSDAVKRILHEDPNALHDFKYAPFETVMKNIGYYVGEWSASRHNGVTELLKVLIEYIPNGLEECTKAYETCKEEWKEPRRLEMHNIITRLTDGNVERYDEGASGRISPHFVHDVGDVSAIAGLLHQADLLLDKDECDMASHMLKNARLLLGQPGDDESPDVYALVLQMQHLQDRYISARLEEERRTEAIFVFLRQLSDGLQQYDFRPMILRFHSGAEPEYIKELKALVSKIDFTQKKQDKHLVGAVYKSVSKLLKETVFDLKDTNQYGYKFCLEQRKMSAELNKVFRTRVDVHYTNAFSQ